MENNLEDILNIYVLKVQTHDIKIMEYIKLAIKTRYNLSEDEFKQVYSNHLDKYIQHGTN